MNQRANPGWQGERKGGFLAEERGFALVSLADTTVFVQSYIRSLLITDMSLHVQRSLGPTWFSGLGSGSIVLPVAPSGSDSPRYWI